MSGPFEIFSKKLADLSLEISIGHDERTWDYVKSLCRSFWLMEDFFKSPIEHQLAAALIFANDGYKDLQYFTDDPDEPQITTFMTYVIPQVKIDKYTVDFLITVKFRDKFEYVIIECDGHDFHEKTKQQAAHDKRRDRFFTQKGYKILRFSGSEIYNDLDHCVEEIENILFKCVDKFVDAEYRHG